VGTERTSRVASAVSVDSGRSEVAGKPSNPTRLTPNRHVGCSAAAESRPEFRATDAEEAFPTRSPEVRNRMIAALREAGLPG